MIGHEAFPIEPWRLRETRFHHSLLAQTESLFALSNGHIGLRANLDEGEPHGLPGTYLNGVYELRPLPYAEAGFGYPEAGQVVINVANGKLIRLLVEDEPFDVRYGQLKSHERILDFRTGTLERQAAWVTPAGHEVRVRTTRLVSLTQRAVAAIAYEVTAVDAPLRLVIQSELVANEPIPPPSGDPRAAGALGGVLEPEGNWARDEKAGLVHRTKSSGLGVAAAMDHEVAVDANVSLSVDSGPNLCRLTASCALAAGATLRMVKYLAYGWSSERSLPALADQVAAALTAARATGWEDLLSEQRAYLDEFWARADVLVDGDAEVQQAVRFALFHLLQAGCRAEGQPIAAKGLTGSGYDGHCFWDTEAYVLPVLTYTAPHAARDALRWRHSTLSLARRRAEELGHSGAAFPWRTIHGEECSGYWPAGTAAVHIAADIADAVVRYLDATDDDSFAGDFGLELLVETARWWRSLGHHDTAGAFRVDGVTGPDEYSALADNNVYTNLMAERNLLAAAEACALHPRHASKLGVDAEETATWREAAAAMCVPFDEVLGVHPQSEGYTSHQLWDFEATKAEQYPLMLHFPYFDLYRKQVVKQADLVLAMHRRPERFTAAEKARNFAYYERITVRDSSLSACIQAILAAEVGQLSLAHDYLAEAALIDLDDLEHNTRDGLHLAALAGSWLALVNGFGGMRDAENRLAFSPQLPQNLGRLCFKVMWRGRRLTVDISDGSTRYSLAEGEPLELSHHEERFVVAAGHPQVKANPATPSGPRPTQPSGRAPAARSPKP